MILISLLGCTSYIVGQACDLDDQDWHIGYYGDQVEGGIQHASAVNAFNSSPTYGNAGAIWLYAAESVPGRITADFGSYIVRVNPFPLPVHGELLIQAATGSSNKPRQWVVDY